MQTCWVLRGQVAAVPKEWSSPQGLLDCSNAAFSKLGAMLTYLATELETLQRQACPSATAVRLSYPHTYAASVTIYNYVTVLTNLMYTSLSFGRRRLHTTALGKTL